MTDSGDAVIVHVPDGIPELNPCTSGVLLGILVELTTVEILDGPPEGSRNDC